VKRGNALTDSFLEDYCKRLELRSQDVLYLVKRGHEIQGLLRVLGNENFNGVLNEFFQKEISVIGNSDELRSQLSMKI
jgi:hypothetical protein